EYQIECRRLLNKDASWVISRRYNDFYLLNKKLSSFGLELGLPRKKYFGNTDEGFLRERRQYLQQFLDTITIHPLMYYSPYVVEFLESADGHSLKEYEEWTLVSIRNRRQYSLIRHWPGCSWRFSKIYALIKRENAYQDVLSWMAYGVDRVGTDSELHDALQFLNTLHCPYLCENLYSWADEKGIGVIRNLFAEGSLRDRLYKCTPEGEFMQKYGMENDCFTLNNIDVRFIARQVLEALSILLSISFPFIDIHCGNIRVTDLGCELMDYEFALSGQSNFNRPAMIRSSSVHSIEDMMVFNFGCFIHEMISGFLVFPSHSPEEAIRKCPQQFHSILRMIFAPDDNKMPSIRELLENELFSDVTIVRMSQKEIKIPMRVKNLFEAASQEILSRFEKYKKTFNVKLKVEKMQRFLDSEPEKLRRKKIVMEQLELSRSAVQ
uniref:PX domain-containing protein n=1 Tax=Acrobeloides nanus TaxID=290746 RepID=A0A914BXX1_9BILA